jgi:hypothetical protein
LHIYDDNPPAADISCVSSGTLECSVNPSDISSITHNTNQIYVAPNVIIPLTIISFAKKDTENQAMKYVDTEYGHLIAPNLSSIPQPLKIDHLSKKMSEIREDVIQTGKIIYAQDVQHRASTFHNINQEKDDRLDSIISQGNSRTIFKYFSEKYATTNYVEFVKITSPIFLSPVILHKGWIINLKRLIEGKYRFTIARIVGYDTPRCENFVRMIAHKNIKDTVEKWYNNILIRYGCKLLTKKPKGNKYIIATIAINHPIIDNTFQSSFIYIVKTKITFDDSINTFNGGTINYDEYDENGTDTLNNGTVGDDMKRTEQEIIAEDIADDYFNSLGKRFLHCHMLILMTLTFFK